MNSELDSLGKLAELKTVYLHEVRSNDLIISPHYFIYSDNNNTSSYSYLFSLYDCDISAINFTVRELCNNEAPLPNQIIDIPGARIMSECLDIPRRACYFFIKQRVRVIKFKNENLNSEILRPWLNAKLKLLRDKFLKELTSEELEKLNHFLLPGKNGPEVSKEQILNIEIPRRLLNFFEKDEFLKGYKNAYIQIKNSVDATLDLLTMSSVKIENICERLSAESRESDKLSFVNNPNAHRGIEGSLVNDLEPEHITWPLSSAYIYDEFTKKIQNKLILLNQELIQDRKDDVRVFQFFISFEHEIKAWVGFEVDCGDDGFDAVKDRHKRLLRECSVPLILRVVAAQLLYILPTSKRIESSEREDLYLKSIRWDHLQHGIKQGVEFILDKMRTKDGFSPVYGKAFDVSGQPEVYVGKLSCPLLTKDKQQILYIQLLKPIAEFWDSANFNKKPKNPCSLLVSLFYVMKELRNALAHDTTSELFNGLDEAEVAFFFMISCRLIYSHSSKLEQYEIELMKLFEAENIELPSEKALTDELKSEYDALSEEYKKKYNGDKTKSYGWMLGRVLTKQPIEDKRPVLRKRFIWNYLFSLAENKNNQFLIKKEISNKIWGADADGYFYHFSRAAYRLLHF